MQRMHVCDLGPGGRRPCVHPMHTLGYLGGVRVHGHAAACTRCTQCRRRLVTAGRVAGSTEKTPGRVRAGTGRPTRYVPACPRIRSAAIRSNIAVVAAGTGSASSWKKGGQKKPISLIPISA